MGQTVTITYTVTVNNPDTGGKLMVNFVTSADPGSSCPSDSPNPGCTVTVPVLTPALTIVKRRQHRHHHPRRHRALHPHHHRHRPDPLYRRHRHR